MPRRLPTRFTREARHARRGTTMQHRRVASQIGRLAACAPRRRGLSAAPPLPDWGSLTFNAVPTRAMLRYDWVDGAWDNGRETADFNVNIHGLSNVLHYGQGLFEGLKAFHCADGTVRTFNAKANARRLISGACPHMPPGRASRSQPRLRARSRRRAPAWHASSPGGDVRGDRRPRRPGQHRLRAAARCARSQHANRASR